MIDDYTFTLFKGQEKYNVTQMIGNLSRRSSIDTLGEEVTFDKLNGSKVNFEESDLIVIQSDKEEIFRGIIVDKSESGIFQQSFTSFDYAFYLNKSEEIFQCNDIRCDEAIKKLCNKFNISIGNITSIRTLINHIYKGDVISEIIKDMLSKATDDLNIKYRLEMRAGKLYIEPYKNLIVKATFKPAFNLSEVDVTKLIGSFTRNRSIADMKNSILIVSDDEKSSRILGLEKDDASIKKNGLLQKIETISGKDIAQVRNIAKNKLSELNKVLENISIELLGSDKVKAGRILNINDSVTGLSGYYLVKECTHTYTNNIHKMQLSIESIKI